MGLGLLLPHWDGEWLVNWPAQEVGGRVLGLVGSVGS